MEHWLERETAQWSSGWVCLFDVVVCVCVLCFCCCCSSCVCMLERERERERSIDRSQIIHNDNNDTNQTRQRNVEVLGSHHGTGFKADPVSKSPIVRCKATTLCF